MTQLQAQSRFKQIFNNKGNMGPIAEKAVKNFDTITLHKVSPLERLHYFAVGHAFRNIDKDLKEAIFELKLNEEQKKKTPTQFTSLQLESFKIEKSLRTLLNNIRNCNSHYVHTFDKLLLYNTEEDNQEQIILEEEWNQIIKFLKEAFEFSTLNQFLKEKSEENDTFKENRKQNKNQPLRHLIQGYDNKLVEYLRDKFFPNEEKQKEVREKFIQFELEDAIEDLLFITVEEDFEWKIEEDHAVFVIKKGKYFSFHAQLFLLSMFLYKQEANQLISKIRGFKRSEDKYQYKRNLFTFFSKKISSQDIHSEEKHLIYFRDIIQYLNRFPTAWNEYLTPERKNLPMTERLEQYILEEEIFKVFPEYKNDCNRELFLKYTIKELFSEKAKLFEIENFSIDNKIQKKFDYEIETSPELKDIYEKLKIRLRLNEYKKTIKRKEKLEKEGNPLKVKLQDKVNQDKLFTIYGRNRDRFMDFAVRYLAEQNYFGKDAEFKMYMFENTTDQEKYLKEQKNTADKKVIDQNKYHQGRLTCFKTYQKHKDDYQNWDDPFVFQNNAFQIILTFSNGERKKFSIQRKLLIYLLEDALFDQSGTIEDKGKQLLEDYFFNSLMLDFEEAKGSYKTSDDVHWKHRKLLPKRLIYTVHPPRRTDSEEHIHPFEKILRETQEQERRYRLLLGKAKNMKLKEEFIKRNKGKHFKLRFIRKAWHLMYFREIYERRAKEHSHHKSFHITRDEINDFSRWMYAFDEVPQYKVYLRNLLQSKKFMENEEFAVLFEEGKSLDDFYTSTKRAFCRQIKENLFQLKEDSESNYAEILSKKLVYINLSHFIDYLKKNGKLTVENEIIQYKATENIKYLITEYYYADVLPMEEYKVHKHLFNKLRTTKLEDALLYEMAMRYLKEDSDIVKMAKSKVSQILSSEICFDIKDYSQKPLYKLKVPFNKLETLSILIRFKIDQENNPLNKKTSYLGNICQLLDFLNKNFTKLKKYKDDGGFKKIIKNFKSNKLLSFDELNTINTYIISGAVKFTKMHMQLEKYFIYTHKIVIPNYKGLKNKTNFIHIKDIKDRKGVEIFKNYYDTNIPIRDKAFHFGVPTNFFYNIEIKKIEEKFIREEVKPQSVSSFEQLNKNSQSVCSVFMDILHSYLYKRDNNKSDEVKRKEFQQNYFDQIIKAQ